MFVDWLQKPEKEAEGADAETATPAVSSSSCRSRQNNSSCQILSADTVAAEKQRRCNDDKVNTALLWDETQWVLLQNTTCTQRLDMYANTLNEGQVSQPMM